MHESGLKITYQIELPPDSSSEAEMLAAARKTAEQIAIGQTIGTHKSRDQADMTLYSGKVVSVEKCPDGEKSRKIFLEYQRQAELHYRRFLITIDYPLSLVQNDFGSLLSVVFGKVSMSGRIRWVDMALPQENEELPEQNPSGNALQFYKHYQGPRFGIAGIRRKLNVPHDPLLMSIFKPCLGVSNQQLADMIYTQAVAGVNLVKDDEVLSDATVDDACRRLEACLKALQRAEKETGKVLLYAINLTGPAHELLNRAEVLVKNGANAFLFNYLCYGLPMLSALRDDSRIKVPLIAHPALAGAFYASPSHGIAPSLLFGKLPRIAGADLVLFPSPYGSVALPQEDALQTASALTRPISQPEAAILPAFPVPSAGIQADMIPGILQDFGTDVVINAGTGIHDHPQGSLVGATVFREALNHCMNDYYAAQTPQPAAGFTA